MKAKILATADTSIIDSTDGIIPENMNQTIIRNSKGCTIPSKQVSIQIASNGKLKIIQPDTDFSHKSNIKRAKTMILICDSYVWHAESITYIFKNNNGILKMTKQ